MIVTESDKKNYVIVKIKSYATKNTLNEINTFKNKLVHYNIYPILF